MTTPAMAQTVPISHGFGGRGCGVVSYMMPRPPGVCLVALVATVTLTSATSLATQPLLAPTVICPGGPSFGSIGAHCWGSNPSPFNASIIASPKGAVSTAIGPTAYWILIPGRDQKPLPISNAFIHSFALEKATVIRPAIGTVSDDAPLASIITSTRRPANFNNLSPIRLTCSSVSDRGANSSSSAMIFVSCEPLIPSSKPNNDKVHAASITIPTNTAATGSERILGASSMTPSPTSAPPRMVPAIKIKWGQVGSSAPPKNWLMYEYIIAVLVWLFAGVAVIVRYASQRWGR